VLFRSPDSAKVQSFALESTRTTHGAPEALDCSRLLASVIDCGLNGCTKSQMLDQASLRVPSPKVAALAAGSYFAKTEVEVQGTGYAVASLEAALWCFRNTDSFEGAILNRTGFRGGLLA
jgi:ADP-ribosyl-[dinitrogen reductase] hydrolase